MSTSPADFNAGVIEEFRANAGQLGGMFAEMPLLLLHNTGARSGASRVTPLAYLEDAGRYVVFASAAGAPSNPGWYRNLVANPAARIEVGAETLDVLASDAEGEERERLYREQAARVPQFAEYEAMTDRVVPVVVLTRRAGS
jgi:deazaflavin-dependent oxidoreductase (nitroreductase family)